MIFGWRNISTDLAWDFPGREGAVFSARPGAWPAGRWWPWLLVFALAAISYLIPLEARYTEAALWHNPDWFFDGQPLLATHDAYHWLAGAKGFEFGAGHPMSEFLRLSGAVSGISPDVLAFWLPMFAGSLVALAVFAWGLCAGRLGAALVAGAYSALAPGFVGRTLLGYYDTDLVTLLFAVLLGLIPAFWLRDCLASPWQIVKEMLSLSARRRGALERRAVPVVLRNSPVPGFWGARRTATLSPAGRADFARRKLAPGWLALLFFSGLLGGWTREWHSFFLYLPRFYAVLLPALILILGPRGGRRILLYGGLCHALALLAPWLALPALACALLVRRSGRPGLLKSSGPAGSLPVYALSALLLFMVVDKSILELLLGSIKSYLKTGGELSGNPTSALDPLVFPAVSGSILEIQNATAADWSIYFHPWLPVVLAGLAGYLLLLFFTPLGVYFLPLFLLALAGFKLGGRMLMFGAPVIGLGLGLPLGWILDYVLKDLRRRSWPGPAGRAMAMAVSALERWSPVRAALALAASLILCAPLAVYVGLMSQGPAISRNQAESFAWLGKNSPADSIIWTWWDWGYAAQYFALRHTIADGARHGGPSLYLPAAVYTTTDPAFAWRVIKYASGRGNVPGDVFDGLGAKDAAGLMAGLASGNSPQLKPGPEKQYITVSFETLRLGYWITSYGNWDFIKKTGRNLLVNTLPQQLDFNLEGGVILPKGLEPIYASTIDVFEEKELLRRDYPREDGRHFLLNRLSGDKLVADDGFYRTLMVQLLVCPKNDPRFSPYFRLVFDNVTSRVYEVQ